MAEATEEKVADTVTKSGNSILKYGLKTFKWGGLATAAFTAAALTFSTAGLAAPATLGAVQAIGGATTAATTGLTATSTLAAGTSLQGSAALTNAALSSSAGFGWGTWAQVPLEGLQETVGKVADAAEWLGNIAGPGTATLGPSL